MIVYKRWQKLQRITRRVEADCDGWFLFGLIPLYIRRINHG